MSDFKDRLHKEEQELSDKFYKLKAALATVGFEEKVGKEQYQLMNKQYVGMEVYLQALQERIKQLK